jgi:hypothetical protein
MENWPLWVIVILTVLGFVYALLWFLLPICVYCIYSWTWRTHDETKKIRELLERAQAARPPAPARPRVAYPKEDAGSRPALDSP